MELSIKGKVVAILEVATGEGKNGTWKKGGYVIETEGQYPKTVAIELFNDTLENHCPKVGEVVTSHLNITSREYNGKWYSNVGAWKVEKSDASNDAPPQQNIGGGAEPDDLPF